MAKFYTLYDISIHAPSRERHCISLFRTWQNKFQSTLPHGSDVKALEAQAKDAIISIHAPSRERPCIKYTPFDVSRISIHAPSRERHRETTGRSFNCRFQSTLPHGSDGSKVSLGSYTINFNPRSLTGATASNRTESSSKKNFNPRSLTGATAVGSIFGNRSAISIHAPSRERHQWAMDDMQKAGLFQSTLPHGSDEVVDFIDMFRTDFNPRSLTGATVWYSIYKHNKAISIHAPSRERLSNFVSYRDLSGISIHAPSRERPGYNLFRSPTLEFQSTLPHGSDLSLILRGWKPRNFNPRSLTGATTQPSLADQTFAISIHAPSRERHLAKQEFLALLKFQSTLPHGSDFKIFEPWDCVITFQSTLPHGSDQN